MVYWKLGDIGWSSLVSMKSDYLKAKNVGFCFAKFWFSEFCVTKFCGGLKVSEKGFMNLKPEHVK